MNCCSIYKITNSINEKVYIGQTWRTISKRFQFHKAPSSKGCLKLRRAFDKYGRDHFKIELVTLTHTQSCADYWEQYFIKKYDSISFGYNIALGGNSCMFGRTHSEETRIKMSLAQKGVKKRPDQIEQNRVGHLGLPPTKTSFKKGVKFGVRKSGTLGTKRVIDEQGKIRYIKKEIING